MRAFRAVAGLHASLAAALGLTSVACTSAASGGGHSTPPGTDHDASESHFACIDPVPILVSGKDTGYDTCQGGTVRRRAILECPTAPLPPSSCLLDASPSPPDRCTSNSDCNAHPLGICNAGYYPGIPCTCSYGCTRDSDCATGEICLCGDPVGTCMTASCNAGTCGAGLECASYSLEYCPGCPGGFACQTAGDTCFSAGDCSETGAAACSIAQGASARACSPVGPGGSCCSFGRPFLVDHEARVAALVDRPDWRASLAPQVASLSPSDRARLARHWTEAARMEHASIAAFARFVMQLLALGAPPDLVAGAQRAMEDETRHARLAFGMASAYADADIGPGPLAVSGSLEAMDVRTIIATTFEEGCIGETVAALEANESLEELGDRDPAVAAVLATIAADEARHAELAWRSVAWMVSAFGQQACDALQDAMRGALTKEMRQSATIRAEALSCVVVPLAKALLGGREQAGTHARPSDEARLWLSGGA